MTTQPPSSPKPSAASRTRQHTVLFLPDERRVRVAAGTTLLEAGAADGVALNGPCGGKGTCGKCLVRVRPARGSGPETAYFDRVLACQTPVQADVVVDLVLVAVSVQRKSELNLLAAALPEDAHPGIESRALAVAPPSLEAQTADHDRLLAALAGSGGAATAQPEFTLAVEALRALPGALREGKHRVTAVLDGRRVIAVEPGDAADRAFGLAVDVGTTSVVATLVDLHARKALGSATAPNRQNSYGADVVSRITHSVKEPDGLQRLQARAVQVINRLADELARRAGVEGREIHQVTVVGNPTMTHLLLGLHPGRLAVAPFAPVVHGAVVAEGRDLGLHTSPHAPVHVLPNISGFVGSDTVAMILATGLHHQDGHRLAVDIGTNGEIVLAAPGKVVACSAAAGPAFEGAQIKHGTHAAEGAIESVVIEDDVRLATIADQRPLGLCGSGLIDAVAQAVRAGVIEPSGRMLTREEAGHLPPRLRERLGRDEDGNHLVLAFADESAIDGPVVLTQKDVRALQLSKAAIRAGIGILLAAHGIAAENLTTVYLAGAFGNYIAPASALGIGLFPPVPLERIRPVGNAAGIGAQMALLSRAAREEAAQVARSVEHLELSTIPEFHDHFLAALPFPRPPE